MPLRLLRLLRLSALALLCCACTESSDRVEAPRAALEQRAQALAEVFQSDGAGAVQGLSVRLAFETDADLDLFVTGPMLETVYFARRTGKSGGEMTEDIRCETAGERLEEVVFAAPMPGKYRVGVDFPERCRGDATLVPFAVSVRHGAEHQLESGVVEFQQFEVVVMEFEL